MEYIMTTLSKKIYIAEQECELAKLIFHLEALEEDPYADKTLHDLKVQQKKIEIQIKQHEISVLKMEVKSSR